MGRQQNAIKFPLGGDFKGSHCGLAGEIFFVPSFYYSISLLKFIPNDAMVKNKLQACGLSNNKPSVSYPILILP